MLNSLAFWYGLGNMTRKEVMSQTNSNQKEQSAADNSNAIKNPDQWTTGNEEMTGAQKSYLNTLSQEAGEGVDEDLTKAEASKKIDELQHKTGRGLDH